VTAEHHPRATYRLQLHAGFTFDDAAALVGYLAWLGVSHVYCSPVLAPAPGSTHGYDVVDPQRVNPELGGDAGRRRLLAAAAEHGLGLVVDLVPNHLCVARPELNAWWWDLLRRGPDSPYARFFDVDWGAGRLLLPVLADESDLDRLRLGERDGHAVLELDAGCWPVGDTERLPATTPRQVHDRQIYELVAWQRGSAELTYRRFFDVSDLAGVRVEDPVVFEACHALPTSWGRAGEVDGWRIDHPDGLADPTGYLTRLAAATPGISIAVEKILAPGEDLPRAWPVTGTTGYDALRMLDGIHLDPAGERPLTALYDRICGAEQVWPELVHDAKREVAGGLLAAETARLARLGADPDALAEVAACLRVYRTYLPAHGREELEAALAEAHRRRPDLATHLDALGSRLADPGDELCQRFQQTSGMVMAKGVEDTAFYRYHRLVCLNEVGGDPGRFGVSPEEFHGFFARRELHWPRAMTALTTHDTKRSEDVRARLALLSEVPAEWAQVWGALDAAALAVDGGPEVDAPTRYLIAQTVLGAWPIGADRLTRYLEKATREAKRHTSWTDPNPAYDTAVAGLCRAVLDDPDYTTAVRGLVERLAGAERTGAQARALLHAAVPGVPDIYRGSEIGDRTLVDPDNRAPLDVARLAARDHPKQRVLRTVLAARAEGLLAPGCGYEPLTTPTGHTLAFRRGDALVAAARLPLGLQAMGEPPAIALPAGTWTDRLGAGTFSGHLPGGVLASQGGVLLVQAGG
jgi:(1->4)-alpha-D-glucan 1-alpha-D-glucosylmutase